MESDRPTCFIAQPFDNARFDDIYRRIVAPVIEKCGLKPYRVDEDPHKENLLDAIEEGIRSATIVFVDISTDNPNVWLELGYAKASGKPLVLACCKQDRPQVLPFDIRSTRVVYYSAQSPSDFDQYRATLSERVEAARDSAAQQNLVAELSAATRVDNLSPQEIAVLLELIEHSPIQGGNNLALYALQGRLEKRGYTGAVTSIAVARLERRGFVDTAIEEYNDFNHTEKSIQTALTRDGIDWIVEHEDQITPKHGKTSEPHQGYDDYSSYVEEPPF